MNIYGLYVYMTLCSFHLVQMYMGILPISQSVVLETNEYDEGIIIDKA